MVKICFDLKEYKKISMALKFKDIKDLGRKVPI
jgi:hypothetical protein